MLAPNRFTKTDNLLSWKLAALYKPTEASSVYATVANSQKPPGADNFHAGRETASTNANNASLDPQKALNIEVGAQDGTCSTASSSATGALFKSTNKNDLARRPDPADAQRGDPVRRA